MIIRRLLFLLLLFLSLPAAASASAANDRNDAVCGGSDWRVRVTAIANDAVGCKAKDACFFYTLQCKGGRNFQMSSRLNPDAMGIESFYGEYYPVVQLILFILIGLYAAIGCCEDERWSSNFREQLPWLAVFGFAFYLSNIPAHSVTAMGGNAPLYVAPVEWLLLAVTFIGMPLYLLLRLPAFTRGLPEAIGYANFLSGRYPEGSPTPGKRPAFLSRKEATTSRAHKASLEADTEVIEATIRRERARAALADAERDVRNIERGRE